jgi:hypothetical protein
MSKNIERSVTQRGLNPLVVIRRELGLTRMELAVLMSSSYPSTTEINQSLKSILQLETGVKRPPCAPCWNLLEPTLDAMGVNVSQFERDLAAWAGQPKL